MRTYLVTGANSGLGLETTRALAARGERVILAVRDLAKGQAAKEQVLEAYPGAQLELERLDLTDLGSVRALARKDLGIDVLINNAGLGFAPLRLTPEGVNEIFAANHLGHFLLTGLLLERLTGRDDPRIVTVSSGFGKKGTLALDNLDGHRGYGPGRAYIQSKLANALFGAELDRRLRARGSKVKSVLTHPGVAATQMQQKPTGVMGLLAKAVSAFIAQPAASGAKPTLEAATGTGVQGGEVYGPGKGRDAAPVKEPAWPSMRELEGGRALWERSQALTGFTYL